MFYAGMSCAHLSIRRYSNLVAVDEGVGFECPFHLAGAQHSHPVHGSIPAAPFAW
jgi:hypothetical protein